jgi:hypothetical protein
MAFLWQKMTEDKAKNIVIDSLLLHLERMVFPPHLAELKKDRDLPKIEEAYAQSLGLTVKQLYRVGEGSKVMDRRQKYYDYKA